MLSLKTSRRLVRAITACIPSYTVTYLVVIGDVVKSAKGYLEKVINAGIHTVIYDGDADFVCNYQGVEDMIDSLKHKYSHQYSNTPWTEWTVDGVTAGRFKNAGSFSYVRVYKFVLLFTRFTLQTHFVISSAGHLVPAYTIGDLPYGRHASTLFNQAIGGRPISST